jgi:hypothetical protein
MGPANVILEGLPRELQMRLEQMAVLRDRIAALDLERRDILDESRRKTIQVRRVCLRVTSKTANPIVEIIE